MKIVRVTGPSVRYCLSAARERLGVKIADSRETIRSNGGDGSWRIQLGPKIVVEAQIVPRKPAEVHEVIEEGGWLRIPAAL